MKFPTLPAMLLALLLPAILQAAPDAPVVVSENASSYTLANGEVVHNMIT